MQSHEVYDPHCESLLTATRAIWMLYLRGKWDLLAQYGITRAYEPDFELFNISYIQREDGKLGRDVEVFALIRYLPMITQVANRLVGDYQYKTRKSRKEYYR